MTKGLTAEEQEKMRLKLRLPGHFCTSAICANATRQLEEKEPSTGRKRFALSVEDESLVWLVQQDGTWTHFKAGEECLHIMTTDLRKQMNGSLSHFVIVSFSAKRIIIFERGILAMALK